MGQAPDEGKVVVTLQAYDWIEEGFLP